MGKTMRINGRRLKRGARAVGTTRLGSRFERTFLAGGRGRVSIGVDFLAVSGSVL